eukprot:3140601-Rhodomonas_salina.1
MGEGMETGGSKRSDPKELSRATVRYIERIIGDDLVAGAGKGSDRGRVNASATHSSAKSMIFLWENIRTVLLEPDSHSPARDRSILVSFCELVRGH